MAKNEGGTSESNGKDEAAPLKYKNDEIKAEKKKDEVAKYIILN